MAARKKKATKKATPSGPTAEQKEQLREMAERAASAPDWEAKKEELGAPLVDALRFILTTRRGEGRTEFLLRHLVEQAGSSEVIRVVAAHHEQRKQLLDRFSQIVGVPWEGRHRVAYKGSIYLFFTVEEERAGVSHGITGKRFIDHHAVETELARLLVPVR